MRKAWIGTGAAAGLVLAGCNLGATRVDVPAAQGDVVVAGDLDGDGVAELVVGPTPYGGVPGSPDYGMTIVDLPGGAPTTSITGGDLTDAALVDLDADDDLDLVNTDYRRRTGSGTGVHAHLNDGSGAFPDSFGVGGRGHGSFARLAVGDLHGDGRVDAVVVDGWADLHVGAGTGEFAPGEAVPLPEGAVAAAAAIADVDEDGDGDLVVVGQDTSGGQLFVLPSDGGGLGAPVAYPLAGRPGGSVVLGDLDEDGHLDAVVGTDGFADAAAQVLVLAGDGDGAFGTPAITPVHDSFGVDDVELGDIDEDGHADVVYAAEGAGLNVLFGDGAGGLGDKHSLHTAGDHVADAAVADVTGDGVADVASAGGPLAVFPNALDGARTHD